MISLTKLECTIFSSIIYYLLIVAVLFKVIIIKNVNLQSIGSSIDRYDLYFHGSLQNCFHRYSSDKGKLQP